jgi:hypothetical protein
MFIKTDGTLWATGLNGQSGIMNQSAGFLGTGDTSNLNVLTKIGTDANWEKITITSEFGAYAIKTDGTLWGCGTRILNQNNSSTLDSSLTFIQIGTDTDWYDFSGTGAQALYILKNNGSLYGAGSDILSNYSTSYSLNRINDPMTFNYAFSRIDGQANCFFVSGVLVPPSPTPTPTPTPTGCVTSSLTLTQLAPASYDSYGIAISPDDKNIYTSSISSPINQLPLINIYQRNIYNGSLEQMQNISVLANHTKELTESYNEITMALAADANLKFLIPFNGPFGQA